MAEDRLTLGIVGLGKMGGNFALQALEKGISVVGKEKSEKPELRRRGVKIAGTYEEFVSFLEPPRVIYLSLPAGPIIDTVVGELVPHLSAGDVLMDGGNSFYLDSIRREKQLSENNLLFLDCGTSGGLTGARHGACFMVGGKAEGIALAEPILKKLAVKDGFLHTGPPGSGHYVKLVHNGIEFGMLQAIGEGATLLAKCDFRLNLEKVFKNWSNGSVIRCWLVELMQKGLEEQSLEQIESHVEDTGEVNWLVQIAMKKEIPIPVITQSVIELFKSRDVSSLTYQAIALMRHGFGGHPFGKDGRITKERETSRIQKI
ncbi:MAG: decarboxylating 6-phosphogluconate dehydrogenase [Candidatus Abyssobacteria bacterium SURF_5]|uniref:Decarboxylating 6-phosphogluconate dehydrogenase n=1 Tax=Abyssobacteria bacterium (strain SURF_5) TaxID=2093360 RepID=A0A3A4NDX1_ABYX5|nr:MAG: decarboxylating 6-phosphogluconate dehydrogenase [Candidatus Abyssubacteria bacterium SURF_5]